MSDFLTLAKQLITEARATKRHKPNTPDSAREKFEETRRLDRQFRGTPTENFGRVGSRKVRGAETVFMDSNYPDKPTTHQYWFKTKDNNYGHVVINDKKHKTPDQVLEAISSQNPHLRGHEVLRNLANFHHNNTSETW